MAKIDIDKLGELKDEMAFLEEEDVLFVEEDGQNRYVVVPIEIYDAVEDLMEMFSHANHAPIIKVDSSNLELSYDEYERIKDQIMDAVEKTLMPKPEKLN